MKNLLLLLALLFSSFSFAADDSLANNMKPMRYKKRTEPVLNVALVYYGDYYKMEDLDRIQPMLEERFFKGTGSALKMKVLYKAVIPFKHQISNYPEYTQPYVTDIERLQRLWYYDNVGAKVVQEVWELIRKNPQYGINLTTLDSVLVVSGAQFDALGFASGRVAITENPREIAWGLRDGGRVDYITDARVVDELLHEAGHTMFLDHTANQCQKPGLSYQEQQECCALSPSKNDVMSYCRKRDQVNENFYFGYGECTQRIIREKVIPAMLKGGNWNIANRERCL